MSDILIVGADPTGLTLACEIAGTGVPFQLVDAAKRPFSGSREKGMEQRSLEVLDRFGIVETIVNAGHADLPFRQYTGDGESGANRCGTYHCAIWASCLLLAPVLKKHANNLTRGSACIRIRRAGVVPLVSARLTRWRARPERRRGFPATRNKDRARAVVHLKDHIFERKQ